METAIVSAELSAPPPPDDENMKPTAEQELTKSLERLTEEDAEHELQAAARSALIQCRQSHGMTQGVLAERLGVHRTTIGSWENGGRIDQPNLVLLALEHLTTVALSDGRRPILPYAETQREYALHGAPVPDKLRETLGYLQQTEQLLDRLEGVSPKPEADAATGIQALADAVCARSAITLGRLRTLFGDEDSARIPQ